MFVNRRMRSLFGLKPVLRTASLAAFVLCVTATHAQGSFKYRRSILIQHTKVSGPSDLLDFPLLVHIVHDDLKSLHPNGYDIVFRGADGLTPLDHEIEKYEPSTGEVIAWVRIPVLDHDNDTLIYMYYGDTNITAPTANAPGVWNPGYVGVWHLKEDPAALPLADSTSHNNDGVSGGAMTPTDQVAGQIDGSLDFDGIDDVIDMGDRPEFELPIYSWSMWLEGNTAPLTGLADERPLWNAGVQFQFNWGQFNPVFRQTAAHEDASGWQSAQIASVLAGGTWYYIAGTYDGTNIKVYLNGALEDTQAAGPPLAQAGVLAIGSSFVGGDPFPGQLDEVRVSNVVISEDWLATEFNNQNDPSTFYAVAPQEDVGGGVYYSVGASTADLKNGLPTVSLAAGTATFSVAQPDNVGLGDQITYNGSDTVHISGRVSPSVFSVTTVLGSVPVDVTDAPVDAIRRTFNTLTQAVTSSSGAAYVGSGDLVAAGIPLNWVCYDDAPLDDGQIVIDGYITDPTHYIRIFAPTGPAEVGVRQRHAGVAGTGFRLAPSVDADGLDPYHVIDIRDEHVRLVGIEIDGSGIVNGHSLSAVRVSGIGAASEIRLHQNIVHDLVNSNAGSDNDDVVAFNVVDGVAKVSNNIVYDIENRESVSGSDSMAFSFGGGANVNAFLYNNTVLNVKNTAGAGRAAYGVYVWGPTTVTATNNYVGDVLSPGGVESCYFASGGATLTQRHNVSSDGTATGLNSQTSKTDYSTYFLDITNGSEDLHLRSDSNALWGTYGQDLYIDPNLPVFVDIDGEPRDPVTPDIGADEATSSGRKVNYHSIGTDTSNLADIGTASVNNGSVIVTFSGVSLPANIGIGDKLTLDPGGIDEDVYILSVDSPTQVTLQAPAMNNFSGVPYEIQRSYNTFQEWEDGEDGDLVGENRIAIGVAYDDGAFVEGVLFEGSATDPDHYMMLTVADGHRHDGSSALIGSIVYMTAGDDPVGEIYIKDDYTVVEWLLLRHVKDSGGDVAAVTVEANNVLLQNLIINESEIGIRTQGAGAQSFTVRNTIIHGIDQEGIRGNDPMDSAVIENCTLYSMGGNGVDANGSTFDIVNTISMYGAVDFVVSGGVHSYNMSSDASAPGPTSLTDKDPNLQFVNIGVAPFDLHLVLGSEAIDAGTDRSSTFIHDIDWEGRPAGLDWDMGADEFNSVPTAVELRSFEATGLDGEVLLEWETASEVDNLGFYIYRSESMEGPYERVNSIAVPGLGSSPVGAKYSYRDQGVVNGKTYFYELEDFEASGRRERHGPVSARPEAGLTSEGPVEGGGTSNEGSPSITVGETGSTLREVGRGRGYVELELVTRGFSAVPLADGSMELSVAGFAEDWEAGSPAVPVKRVWIEALAGKDVRIGSVRASDVRSFTLRPSSAEAPAVVVESGGTVRAGRKPRQSRRNRLARGDERAGLYPEEPARVVSVGFEGEEKKALLELAPLRWNPSTGRLLLAQSLVVRVEFDGAVAGERSLGGTRGRRYRGGTRPEAEASKVLARLSTSESGLYGVSYEAIYGSRGRGLSTSELRLSRQGESVAYRLEPSSNVFGPGSVLYFVSEGGNLNPYGVEAVYELEVGGSGELMGEDATPPSGLAMSHYFHREEVEENHFYATSFETPLWLWATLLSGMGGSYGFEVSELSATTESGEVEVWLKGVSRVEAFYPPRVRLSVNGVVLMEEEWESEELHRMRAEVPPGVLREGTNDLTLENVSSSAYTAVMLDRFSLSYPRQVSAESGVLRGKWSESGRAEVSGLEGAGFVLDVTESKPIWLTQTVPVVGGLTFHANSDRTYLAVSPGTVLRPEVRRATPSRLKNKNQQADYLVLGPKGFLGASIPLLGLRRSQGLRSRAVSLEEVYAEFGHGESRPEAIREFLAYAYHEWQRPSIRYVVLLGDGSYDYKDYLGTGVENHVPPRLEKTSFLWTASDAWYGRVNGDDVLADISVGRLPASTVEEARAMVDKIVAYEGSGQSINGSVVLVTDDPDKGGDFELGAEELAGSVLVNRTPRKIYLRELGVESARSAIVQAFDEGSSLLSYIGHGSITFWAQENVFDGESVSQLRPQSAQPLVLTMNCLNGFFHYPYLDALAEELVKAEDKGAIAVVSPSGLSLNGPAHRFHRALLEELTSGEHSSLGDAMLAAQSTYADKGEFLELLTIFHVFGDPALRLQR